MTTPNPTYPWSVADLRALSDRERRVIELRYGVGELQGAPPSSLENVAKRFGLTRERIRQIEQQALAKLPGTKDV